MFNRPFSERPGIPRAQKLQYRLYLWTPHCLSAHFRDQNRTRGASIRYCASLDACHGVSSRCAFNGELIVQSASPLLGNLRSPLRKNARKGPRLNSYRTKGWSLIARFANRRTSDGCIELDTNPRRTRWHGNKPRSSCLMKLMVKGLEFIGCVGWK